MTELQINFIRKNKKMLSNIINDELTYLKNNVFEKSVSLDEDAAAEFKAVNIFKNWKKKLLMVGNEKKENKTSYL